MSIPKARFRGNLSILGQNKILRGASTVAMGTAIGQGITMLAAPAITRMYTPEEVGYFATFTALTNFFIAFVCLRLEQAILISDAEERRDIIATCLISLAVVVAGFSLLIFIAPPAAIGVPLVIRPTLAIVGAVTIAATGLFQICQHLALRERRLREIASYQISKSVIGTGMQLALAFAGIGFLGLTGGQVAGLVLAVLPLLYLNHQVFAEARQVRWADIRRILSKFRSFALFGAPQSLLQATTFSMPVLMIGALFGSGQTAIFWLGYRVFGLPSQVIIESVRASLLSNFGHKIREHNPVTKLWLLSTAALGGIMVPLPLVLAVAGKALFGFVFGPEWAAASTVTIILSFAWIAQNARVPSVVVLQLTGNQRSQLGFEICGTIGRAIALSGALVVPNFHLVLVLFAMVNLAQSAATILYAKFKISQFDRHIASPIAPVL